MSSTPSCSPSSQCGLGVKLNSGGLPHLRTSLLSSAERPTGTDSCGTLGIPASIVRISWSISPACFSSSSLCARKALVCSICAVASCPAFFSLAISSDARFRCAFSVSDCVISWRRFSSTWRNPLRTCCRVHPAPAKHFFNLCEVLSDVSKIKHESNYFTKIAVIAVIARDRRDRKSKSTSTEDYNS